MSILLIFLVVALKYDWQINLLNFVLQCAVTILRQSDHVEFINYITLQHMCCIYSTIVRFHHSADGFPKAGFPSLDHSADGFPKARFPSLENKGQS